MTIRKKSVIEIETNYDDKGFPINPGYWEKGNELGPVTDLSHDTDEEVAKALGCTSLLVSFLRDLCVQVDENLNYINEDIKEISDAIWE